MRLDHPCAASAKNIQQNSLRAVIRNLHRTLIDFCHHVMVGGIANIFDFVKIYDMTIIGIKEHICCEIVLLLLARAPLRQGRVVLQI